ncbi:MAG: histidinol dehydrogenase [Selenomonadaceae bacterium]|nr:histidinol dehydrogenase [Selenomonadaceae bacterium]
MKIYRDSSDIEKILTKKSFDEIELSPKIREANRKLFGEDLTAIEIVRRIIAEVRANGDQAVKKYTELLDGSKLDRFEVSYDEFSEAESKVDPKIMLSLERAASNIRQYHEEQKPNSWMTFRDKGSILGQSIVPLRRVGIYVPGGTAAYPSSVLMNAIPAAVSGVSEIFMAVPTRNGELNPYVLMAARIAGVDRVFKIGGAQAIAAFAFGTESIPRVDKIAGPGNIFVTLAKKEVYGHCDIDMLAGPSEILIVADESADPILTAADLLSQAEHDPLATSILITTDQNLADRVSAEVDKQLAELPRREIAETSIDLNGKIIVTENLDRAIDLANISAPEHLELLVKDPWQWIPKIDRAGAIFLGSNSPEPLGDYFAGPSHVLPTGGSARFSSVLSVETFLRRVSLISYTRDALENVSKEIISLAKTEGLDAHARAIEKRF